MTEPRSPRAVTRILGLSRSGNHAIIEWILSQLPGRWCFLNCVAPGVDPFIGARPTDHGTCHLSSDPDFIPPPVGPSDTSSLDQLLFSQEDCFLRSAWGPDATAVQEHALGGPQRRVDLLILRDPYNLFASRRRFEGRLVEERTALRIWKQHARAFLGERTCLSHPIVAVSFNRWRENAAYRRKLAEGLGLRFNDAGLEQVPACGNGSSFDGYRFQGQASRMPVHERWRHFAADPGFRSLFDPQLQALAARIFGPPPWQAQGEGREAAEDAELPRVLRPALGA